MQRPTIFVKKMQPCKKWVEPLEKLAVQGGHRELLGCQELHLRQTCQEAMAQCKADSSLEIRYKVEQATRREQTVWMSKQDEQMEPQTQRFLPKDGSCAFEKESFSLIANRLVSS